MQYILTHLFITTILGAALSKNTISAYWYLMILSHGINTKIDGGSLEVKATEGKGIEFIIKLPLSQHNQDR